VRSHFATLGLLAGVVLSSSGSTAAQEDEAPIRVRVNLVQLNVAVTDKDGNYVTGLRPEDFSISEDKISQKIATFEEGNEPARDVASPVGTEAKNVDVAVPSGGETTAANMSQAHVSPFTDASVFILFDTSNYMYRGFIFAQDAIAGFVRSLQTASKVAFYSYSRDLSRAATLTTDRSRWWARRGSNPQPSA
jgi:Ca-activated chloride channel family protein